MLDDINYVLTKAISNYTFFKHLNNKLIENENWKYINESVLEEHNVLFMFLFYGFKDLGVLRFSKILDKNSKKINLYKIITYIENNYPKLNRQSEVFFRDKWFFSKFESITFEEIQVLRSRLDEENKTIDKIKDFRDKKIAHSDNIENLPWISFEELDKLYNFFVKFINEIDLRFFSNQTTNLQIKEDTEDWLDYLFEKLKD